MSEDITLRNLVADAAAAYFRNNHVRPSEIPAIISQIAASFSAIAAPAFGPAPEKPQQPKLSQAEIRKSITSDALISFEDNKPYRTLRRHLRARGMSPEDYRRKWGLPEDYP
ncbi:MAG TPA: MucR family transcriptional regulator, partial [Phenylobacterium sp.]|uniref:MucR family transcriptional regulator n=1 Tax=Phenylobacterium sp. TaxID=1871053 RepID=UPI002B470295